MCNFTGDKLKFFPLAARTADVEPSILLPGWSAGHYETSGTRGKEGGTSAVGLLPAPGSASVVSSKADLLCEKSRHGDRAGFRGVKDRSKPRLRSSASN